MRGCGGVDPLRNADSLSVCGHLSAKAEARDDACPRGEIGVDTVGVISVKETHII